MRGHTADKKQNKTKYCTCKNVDSGPQFVLSRGLLRLHFINWPIVSIRWIIQM